MIKCSGVFTVLVRRLRGGATGVLPVFIKCLTVGRAMYNLSSGVFTVLIRCSGVLSVDTVFEGGASGIQI